MTRKSLSSLRSAAMSLVGGCLIALAPAQVVADVPYPEKAVKIIVPMPAGGSVDAVARMLAAALSTAFGKPFVVENRAGASGTIGADAVAKSPADGYTLLMPLDITLTVVPFLYSRLSFDPSKHLRSVVLLASSPNVLVVSPSLPVNSIGELVALAKKQGLHYASGGNGSPGHLAAELFKKQASIGMTHVPYKGLAPAVTAMLAGDVQVFFASISGVEPHIKAGKLRPLAVTSAGRDALMPNLPTMRESGFRDFDVYSWYALFAPSGTPDSVVNALYEQSAKAFNSASVQERLLKQGLTPLTGKPGEVSELIRRDQ
ncbi:MAG: tripartite tricarboxylate transporter substrate binding protein, partial [Betaproteobacteria bacterium]|nr:tripartite tricarboxylate transporter substrate binding protein [Betaproteobacteria bacterium]